MVVDKKDDVIIQTKVKTMTENSNKLDSTKKKTFKRIKLLFFKLLFISLFIYVTFGYIFGLKRMNSPYMTPNIKEGDLLFYYRLETKYKVGDVVLIKKDDKEYILRIVAAANQEVDINDDEQFLVDGYLEPYTVYYRTGKVKNSNIKYPYKLSNGEYFVLSDYRLSKNDSRSFMTITKKDIKGKIISKLQVRNL